MAKKLEGIQCRFLFDTSEEKGRYYLVRWEDIEKPLPLDGLRLRSLVEMNVALQSKWLWKFMINDDMLWKRIVVAKFGVDERGWFTRDTSRPHGKGL